MSSNLDQYPYDTVVYITDTIDGQGWQGSGVLISPDEVLTASHVVYNSTNGAATNIKVSLGYDDGSVAIGSSTAENVHYNPIQDPNDEITAQQSQSDYAVIHLATPFTGVGTMGLEANFPGGPVNVSGYPAAASGQLDTSQQTVSLEPTYTIFDGTSIGAGSSGGPVWVTASNGEPQVVGLVSSAVGGVGSEAFFSQISSSELSQIESWVAEDDGSSEPLTVQDNSTGQQLTPGVSPYSGPVAGLQNEYINLTSDSLNITATTPGWFIHAGNGNDMLTVSSGTNVLDGDTSSSFMTGGSGTDTFFADESSSVADLWDTVNHFHVGDAATLWGITPAGFDLSWTDNQGAPGYLGLTLHASAAGETNLAMTFVGFSLADLTDGRLAVSFATAGGVSYLNIAEAH